MGTLPPPTPFRPRHADETGLGGEPGQHVVVLSGLSGAGKTAATKLFEDLGYACVDNLPGELLPDLADLIASDPARFDRVAIVLDVRAGDASVAFSAMRGALEGRGIRPQVFFLEARDDALIRRYSETRHRHPLAGPGGIATSIAEERRLLAPVRAESDVVLDTSDLSLRELKERIFSQLWQVVDPDQLAIQLISFGYKFGVPLECDLVFDVRFLQNPFYVPELRRQSGLTRQRPRVRPGPAARAPVPGLGRAAARPDPAGLPGRGQDATDGRDRLHRRLPPLDRAGRGDRRVARDAGVRRDQHLPPRARTRVRRA